MVHSLIRQCLTIVLVLEFGTATTTGPLLTKIIVGKTNLTTPVTYNCDFTSLWTAKDHPNDFPSTNHHWSPMVLVSHSENLSLWSYGTNASIGIRNVAETGSTTVLQTEFQNGGDDIGNFTISTPGFFPTTESSTRKINGISMDKDHRYLSSISMVAPSPDWFTGFDSVEPLEAGMPFEAGMWWDSFTIFTNPWDAGTDSGSTYTSTNQASNPQEGIFQLIPETLPSSNVFLSPDGTVVKPVAKWECSIDTGTNDNTDTPDSEGNIQTLSLVTVAALFAIFFLL